MKSANRMCFKKVLNVDVYTEIQPKTNPLEMVEEIMLGQLAE